MNIKSKNNYIYLAAIILVAALVALVIFNNKEEIPLADEQRNDTVVEMGEANLSWNPNKESDIAGYRIYYGTTTRREACPPGGYREKIDAGNSTSYKVENLKKDTMYYFSITSYNKAGKESCFSDEVSKTVK